MDLEIIVALAFGAALVIACVVDDWGDCFTLAGRDCE